MTIKKTIPWILLTIGLAWTGSVAIANSGFAGPSESFTVPLMEDGKIMGTTTTRDPQTGSTTRTKSVTVGDQAGLIVSETNNSEGELLSYNEKSPDGSVLTVVREGDSNSFTATETKPDGTKTTKLGEFKDGNFSPRSVSVAHADGSSKTTTFDVNGNPTGMTIKDAKGKITKAVPDGKGGFTSAAKQGKGVRDTVIDESDDIVPPSAREVIGTSGEIRLPPLVEKLKQLNQEGGLGLVPQQLKDQVPQPIKDRIKSAFPASRIPPGARIIDEEEASQIETVDESVGSRTGQGRGQLLRDLIRQRLR